MNVIGTEPKRSYFNGIRNRLWRAYRAPKTRAGVFHLMVLSLLLMGAISRLMP